MAIIVLKIPTGPKPTDFVQGECQLEGFKNFMMIDSVSYDITVDAPTNSTGRRTIHSPVVSELTIERQIDLGSIDLAKHILSLRIPSHPWEIYFLRNTGLVDAGSTQAKLRSPHQAYMAMLLQEPVITNQSIDIGEDSLTETLSISVVAIDWMYTAYDEVQRPIGHTSFSFDVQAGQLS